MGESLSKRPAPAIAKRDLDYSRNGRRFTETAVVELEGLRESRQATFAVRATVDNLRLLVRELGRSQQDALRMSGARRMVPVRGFEPRFDG